ncbi:hypothetical protein BLA29_005771 [Euroglyphus maynei]|uniref:Fatty acid desaturase domain-containing protein n=1 Tax=Euroglyphus maynei TaxID=6958 RepID=A0A1Y3BJI4_EURMA|nr:hypothetical protein BLA29_005771 [Euroglyphus maynei]
MVAKMAFPMFDKMFANDNHCSCETSKVIIVWRNVFTMIILHIFSVYGLISTQTMFQTILWTWFIGFFFSHMGWLMVRKHPDVIQKGKTVDLSDVWADPIVRFQRRFYIPLVLLLWGIVPVMVPIYGWQEDPFIALSMNLFRYVISLHHTWLVNSVAHIYGYRFYDRNIGPRENKLVAYLTYGEGYHNYHHVFPWDYSASEYGWQHCFNMTTAFIDCCAWFGLVHDRRTVAKSVIEDRITRTGEEDSGKPFGFEQQRRKPRSLIMDTAIGLVLASWALIFQYSIRFLMIFCQSSDKPIIK